MQQKMLMIAPLCRYSRDIERTYCVHTCRTTQDGLTAFDTVYSMVAQKIAYTTRGQEVVLRRFPGIGRER